MANDSNQPTFDTWDNRTGSPIPKSVADTHLTVWFAVNFILMLVSVTFLILAIYAVVKAGQNRISASQILILHFLSAELAICSGLYPAIQFTYYLPKFRFGTYSCDIFQFFYMWIAGAEQWTMLNLSINRLMAVHFPHSYSRYVNTKSVLVTLAFAWIVPLIVMIMLAAKFGGQSMPVYIPWGTCVVRPSPSGQSWVLQAVNFLCMVIPLSGTLLCYAIILLGSWKKYGIRRTVPDDSVLTPAQQSDLQRQRKKLSMARMLFVSAFWYLLCYLPHTMIVSLAPFLYAVYPHLGLWTRTVYFMGFAGNPVIFFIMSAEYRTKLVSLIHARRAVLSRPTSQ
ncbi:galanin receptor 2a-like [Paramacrobiotus metropolitanus]|uniref:galanin receptor 2a-like n=1 Tax=Paramacrobiotus metropolitanus TaxID=2943436 RepID=UPI00244623A2|nr:galanin receptor 2a-like [Paramacrobiotus metropolitanus]